MRAWVRDGYGPPDILRLETLPDPVPGPDDVLVRVRAASINRADLDYLTGSPAISRLAIGVRRPRHRQVGLDAAGEVVGVGAAVTALRPGDRVYGDLTGHGQGAFAELACAPARAWHPIPERLSYEAASTVPESAILAYQGIRSQGGARAGQRVLIVGVTGSVGPFALQLAKAAGAHVTGVCRTSKVDLARELGADDVIDHAREDWTRLGRRWDRVLDCAGAQSVFAVRRALTPGGVYSTYGSPSTWRILQTLVCGPLLSIGRDRRLGLMLSWKPGDPKDMAEIGRLLEAGVLVPCIDRTFPLEAVPDALRHVADGRARGKVVITV